MSAAPKHEPKDFDLRGLIRTVAEDEPDPHRIAERIAGLLSLEDVRTALQLTLPGYVRTTIGLGRVKRHGYQEAEDSPISRKWQNVVEQQTQIKLLRQSVFAQGTWKFLGDCDTEDLSDLAHRRLQAALDNEQWAERFDRAAKALTKHKAATVQDLPADIINEIFHA
jgi:hypothetical protein